MPRKKSHIQNNPKKKSSFAEQNRKNFEYYANPPHYDRTLRDYRDRLKSKYSKAYDADDASLKSRFSKETYDLLCLGTAYRKRRISACLDALQDYAVKFEKQYPDMCIEDELGTFFSILMSRTPDISDFESNITLALALFILDSIHKSGNYPAAVYFIPRDKSEETNLPFEFTDTLFENDVISGVMYLIENRMNSASIYFSPETAKISNDNTFFCEYGKYTDDQISRELEYRAVSDDTAVRYFTMAEKMTMQERYYALISFIRPEIIERAVSAFRSKTDEMIKIVLEMLNESAEKCAELAGEGISLTYELEKLEEKRLNQADKLLSRSKQLKNNKNILNVLSNQTDNKLNGLDDQDMDDAFDAISTMNQIDNISDKITEITEEIKYQDMLVKGRFDRLRYKMYDNTRCSEPKEAESFAISNPYEILFGYLYLLDSGDSLPWVPHIFENVCGYAVQQLPWNDRYNSVYEDLLGERMDKKLDELHNEPFKESPKADNENYIEDDSDEYTDIYEMKYNDAFIWYRDHFKIQKDELLGFNLAQIIYADSSVCMPRYREDMYEDVQGFVKSGFSRKQAEIIRYFKSFAESTFFKCGFQSVIKTENLIRERSGGTDNQSPAELQKLLECKNAEIESLKKKLYESEKQSADLNKKIDRMQEDSDSENQELLELRDLIYKIQNSMGCEDQEPDKESDISFPYITSARVVVFGGHATWLKVIVKLLPNVKFIDPYADPDVNTIKNADVVWMQTNAMPHSRYNKIMEIVRLKKIPVKYFAYASAEKCAVQLAEYDSES